MKRWGVVLIILLLAGLVMGGQLLAQDETPKYGGTLRAAWDAEWASLDPHLSSAYSSFAVLANVVEALTDFDDNGQLIPALATSWEQSEDGLTWTFQLREGVTFSNGREFTADDVKYSMDRILDPALGSGRVDSVGGADAVWEVVDPYTVTVTTSEPNAILPIQLAGAAGGAIIGHESADAEGNVVIPIGTGPFIIDEVNGTTSLRLVRNPNYWQEGLPYLDAVEIEVYPEAAPREAALQGGEVDFVLNVSAPGFDALNDDPEIVVAEVAGLNYQYMGLNLNREPLGDVRVRQALAYAIDRQQICDAGEFGRCVVIQGPTGPSSAWYFDYAPYDRDIEKAKQLLAEAGYPDGFEIELMPTSTYEDTVRRAQVLVAQLAEIGVRATINAPEWSQWLELEGAGNYDIYTCGWTGLTDGNSYFYLQHRTDQVFNFTGYSNPEFDRLVDEARTVSDFDTRYALYEQANKIIVDEAPYIYFYTTTNKRAYRPFVKGYVLRGDNANRFHTTWLDQ